MKRLVALFMAVLLCVSMIGCGGDSTGSSDISDPNSVSQSTSGADSSGTDGTDTSTTGTTLPADSSTTAQTGGSATTATRSTSSATKKTEFTPTTRPVVHATLPAYNIKGKTVELLTSDSAESEDSKTLIARFKEAYGATLKMTSTDWSKLQTQLNARVLADNPPDVVVVRNADYYTYQLSGILKDISGLIDYDSALWKDMKAANEEMQITDKQYIAIIQKWVGWYIWYNKSLMLDNGIVDTPDKLYEQGKWTVSAMRSLAKELTIRDGEQITQYGLGSDYGTLANSLEVARGAKQVIREGSTFKNNINDSKLADAFNMLYDLYAADKCMTPIDQQVNLFAKGRCAMLLDGSWLPQQRSIKAMKEKGTIGLVPFPKWDGEPEYQSGEYTATGIPRNVDNTDLGMAFINFQRYLAIDADQIKKNETVAKNNYALTDAEIKYQNQATQHAVVGSWLGIPNSPSYLMAMMVAYGNAWSLAVEQYGPELQKSVDELNATIK